MIDTLIRAKMLAQKKVYHAAHRNGVRDRHLQKRYGISLATYAQMLEAQGGVCAICGGSNASGRRLAVDHCHKTGRVRKLLCSTCNCAVGLMKEDSLLACKIAQYMKDHHEIQ